MTRCDLAVIRGAFRYHCARCTGADRADIVAKLRRIAGWDFEGCH